MAIEGGSQRGSEGLISVGGVGDALEGLSALCDIGSSWAGRNGLGKEKDGFLVAEQVCVTDDYVGKKEHHEEKSEEQEDEFFNKHWANALYSVNLT